MKYQISATEYQNRELVVSNCQWNYTLNVLAIKPQLVEGSVIGQGTHCQKNLINNYT